MTVGGLPHSGTPGSQPARGSPGRIVVRHALHRLSAPRHPPVALCSLITSNLVLFGDALANQAIPPPVAEAAAVEPPVPRRRQSALVFTC
jgi:hypothetical protein